MRLPFILLSTLLLLCTNSTFSQQIKGQIVDAKTKEPIAFATVQFNGNNGVVSNMEGFFTMPSEGLDFDSILSVSFMGYETQRLTIQRLKDQSHILKLNESINQLNTVYLTNRVPSVDSIMARVHKNLELNYQFSDVHYTLFTRETTYYKAHDLKMNIEKSSGFNKKQLEASNKQFGELTNSIVNNPPTQMFTDVLSDIYLKSDYKGKMEVRQATKLIDLKNNLTLETIQSKVSAIALQHLDTTKTYKVKTGWFKVEDSLSFKKSKEVGKDSANNNFEKVKSDNINTIKEHLFDSASVLDFVLDTKDYNYQLINLTTIDDQLVYIINFKPKKSKAKFQGTLYINDEDHAILKLDYGYAEGKIGEKLNLKLLLGVKYIEKVNKGTVIYKRNPESKNYYPYYINHESGRYVYAHRPFKFTENSNIIKNKVAFDMTLEGTIVQKQELMSLDYKPFDSILFNEITEAKKVDYIKLKQYDSSIWQDYTIMEPLEELKKFKVED
ncbi:MAG: carboxypeptidase-like regulatory domain-containing protein [Gelidibacter sp.]